MKILILLFLITAAVKAENKNGIVLLFEEIGTHAVLEGKKVCIKLNFNSTLTLEEYPNAPGVMGVTYIFDINDRFYKPIEATDFVEMSAFSLNDLQIELPVIDSLKTLCPGINVSLGKVSFEPLDTVFGEYIIYKPSGIIPTWLAGSSIGKGSFTTGAGWNSLETGIKEKSFLFTTSTTPLAQRALVRFNLFIVFKDGENKPVILSTYGIDHLDITMKIIGSFKFNLSELM